MLPLTRLVGADCERNLLLRSAQANLLRLSGLLRAKEEELGGLRETVRSGEHQIAAASFFVQHPSCATSYQMKDCRRVIAKVLLCWCAGTSAVPGAGRDATGARRCPQAGDQPRWGRQRSRGWRSGCCRWRSSRQSYETISCWGGSWGEGLGWRAQSSRRGRSRSWRQRGGADDSRTRIACRSSSRRAPLAGGAQQRRRQTTFNMEGSKEG